MIDRIIATLFALALSTANLSARESAEGYLSAIEQSVLDELNLARSNPKNYAKHLKALRRHYHGNEFRRPGEVILVTHEGVSAVDEVIGYLSTVEPVATLTPSRGLSKSAADHAREQARTGGMGHVGGNGSQPWDRMSRYGTWRITVAENIYYGSSNPRDIVLQLIIDDGVEGRGHRLNIFNSDYRVVGIGCGPHAQFDMMCVMNFAAGFSETQL